MAERASVKPNRNDKDGDNRLELLLFRLGGRQKYGINVFKVQEVIHYTALTHVPGSHPLVSGIANLRGRTMSILDLSSAIGGRAIAVTVNFGEIRIVDCRPRAQLHHPH